MKTAVVKVNGADCPSCVYTLEHAGKKVEGVEDVRVDPEQHTITVDYQGNPGSVERIAEIVRMLGYDAEIQWKTVREK